MKLDISALRGLAPSMRRAIGITLLSVIVSVLIGVFGIRQQLTALHALDEKITSINERIGKMQSDISNADRQKAATQKALSAFNTLSTTGVIEPLLGSFAMRAKTLLDPIAQNTGFRIESVRELSPIALQLPSPAPVQRYCRQPIEVSGQGSYAEIMSFVSETEHTRPMSALASIRILCQPITPETHKVLLIFEWPAKGEKAKTVPALGK